MDNTIEVKNGKLYRTKITRDELMKILYILADIVSVESTNNGIRYVVNATGLPEYIEIALEDQ